MFLGTYTPKLDDKGRLTLPAKFRDELAGGLMVTKGQDHSLAVYPREEFAARVRKAAAVSRTNPQARAFIRNLAASADEQRPDGNGRITLSAGPDQGVCGHRICGFSRDLGCRILGRLSEGDGGRVLGG